MKFHKGNDIPDDQKLVGQISYSSYEKMLAEDRIDEIRVENEQVLLPPDIQLREDMIGTIMRYMLAQNLLGEGINVGDMVDLVVEKLGDRLNV